MTAEPQSIVKLRVVDGTMEFNKGPGPDVFTNGYKPDPPRSESYRKLANEYAGQQISLNPGNAEILLKFAPAAKPAGQRGSRSALASLPAPGLLYRSLDLEAKTLSGRSRLMKSRDFPAIL